MQLFYCPNIIKGDCTLPEVEAKHCSKVLRKNIGDKIDIIDGEGTLYSCTIVDCSKKDCVVEIDSTTSNFGSHSYNLHIAIAPTKNIDRIEWFLEKSTEIGIDTISFIGCKHSERTTIKEPRLEKVVVSAMKQSLKAFKPTITPMTSFSKFINQDFNTDQLYIAHCNDDIKKVHLKDVATNNNNKQIVILIGPEGDFSTKEIEEAISKGFKPISLGDSRLRTETAALYSTCVISLL